jgi:hypothetical protein
LQQEEEEEEEELRRYYFFSFSLTSLWKLENEKTNGNWACLFWAI